MSDWLKHARGREACARSIGGDRHRARRLIRRLQAVARSRGFRLLKLEPWADADFVSARLRTAPHASKFIEAYSALEFVENRGRHQALSRLFAARCDIVRQGIDEHSAMLAAFRAAPTDAERSAILSAYRERADA